MGHVILYVVVVERFILVENETSIIADNLKVYIAGPESCMYRTRSKAGCRINCIFFIEDNTRNSGLAIFQERKCPMRGKKIKKRNQDSIHLLTSCINF